MEIKLTKEMFLKALDDASSTSIDATNKEAQTLQEMPEFQFIALASVIATLDAVGIHLRQVPQDLKAENVTVTLHALLSLHGATFQSAFAAGYNYALRQQKQ